MKMFLPSTDSERPRGAGISHESARRQFWLSLTLLLALAFAAPGQVRQVGEERAAVQFGRGHVVKPTFIPSPPARTLLPAAPSLRVG